MRDYSDITGTAAKLNLLASPCACGALQRELCVSMCDMQEPIEEIVQSMSVCIQLPFIPSIHLSINVSIKKLSQFAGQHSVYDVHN